MKYSISAKQNEKSLEIKNRLSIILENNNFVFDEKCPEVVFVIGGDGTFLKTVHKYIDRLDSICFIGIKTGTLGYFFEYSASDLDEVVDNVLNNSEYFIEEHNLIEATLKYENDEKYSIYAINEVRIENPFKTLECNVYINGEFLETFRGSGLLVSSSLGSTGYNKSCNGAVIDTSLNLLQLTEINPINNYFYSSLNNSLILKNDAHIVFEGPFDKEIIGFDNKIDEKNGKLLLVDIYMSDKKVKLLRFSQTKFIDKLRSSFLKE
ncbi:MAG: NAD(+)/NADH kinase [Bacilli bacterium]